MDRSSRQIENQQGIGGLKWHTTSDGFNRYSEYTFFSSAHVTFSRIDHMLEHKTSLNKFKKIEIISSILSDHNSTKLEVNHKKKTLKNPQRHEG